MEEAAPFTDRALSRRVAWILLVSGSLVGSPGRRLRWGRSLPRHRQSGLGRGFL